MVQQGDEGPVEKEMGREKKRRKRSDAVREGEDEIRGGTDFAEKSSVPMWSELPYDLINEVANQLDAVEDFLAFTLVCRSWRSVYLKKTWTSIPRFPLLVLDITYNGIAGFFSLYKKKILRVPLPEAHNWRCWGSSFGWLIIICPNLKIHLLNPLTRVPVDLPPISTFVNLVDGKGDWFNLIHKATILKAGNESLIMAIYGHLNSLAFVRLGESTWTTVKTPTPFRFTDVICFKGKILGLSLVGTLAVVEIDGQEPPSARPVVSPPREETGWHKLYLVESCDDLLLLFYYGGKFKVYQFDFDSWGWKKLESLGDRVLFVDDCYCISASCGSPYLKMNSIYFAEDNVNWWTMGNQKRGALYICVYNMKSKTTETIFSCGVRSLRYCCPVWLIPSLW